MQYLITCKVGNIVKQLWMIFFVHSFNRITHSTIRRFTKSTTKECHLFREELQYMGNTIFIKDRRVYVKPLRNRLEAIQKLQPRDVEALQEW